MSNCILVLILYIECFYIVVNENLVNENVFLELGFIVVFDFLFDVKSKKVVVFLSSVFIVEFLLDDFKDVFLF